MKTSLQTISTKLRAMIAAVQMHVLITLMGTHSASHVVGTQPRLMHPVSVLLAKDLGLWEPRRAA